MWIKTNYAETMNSSLTLQYKIYTTYNEGKLIIFCYLPELPMNRIIFYFSVQPAPSAPLLQGGDISI